MDSRQTALSPNKQQAQQLDFLGGCGVAAVGGGWRRLWDGLRGDCGATAGIPPFLCPARSCPQPPRSHSAASPSPRSRPTAQGDFGGVGTLRHCGGAREEKINWFIVCGLMNQLIPGTYEPINFAAILRFSRPGLRRCC